MLCYVVLFGLLALFSVHFQCIRGAGATRRKCIHGLYMRREMWREKKTTGYVDIMDSHDCCIATVFLYTAMDVLNDVSLLFESGEPLCC